jgi:hypothetical protein
MLLHGEGLVAMAVVVEIKQHCQGRHCRGVELSFQLFHVAIAMRILQKVSSLSTFHFRDVDLSEASLLETICSPRV